MQLRYPAAFGTADMDVVLMAAHFVVMASSVEMQQIELIDQAMLFQHRERPVDRGSIQVRIPFPPFTQQVLGPNVVARYSQRIEYDPALSGEPYVSFLERVEQMRCRCHVRCLR